jgi:hypothetical protein
MVSTESGILLRNFYKKSDDPQNHQEYANFFTPEATVIMRLNEYKGHDGNVMNCAVADGQKSLSFEKIHGGMSKRVTMW